MGTLVCFHAHPDDESISTGGSIARANAEGHRVVLVIATDGAYGEVPTDLAPGETLVDRRRAETQRSAEVLGVHELIWLGYADSGMTGWSQNTLPGAFWQAPIDEAAERLAEVLRVEQADVLTVYDWHGNYGHPDHIQVHRVGHRAAELAGTAAVFEATMNRDHFVRMMELAQQFTPAVLDEDGNEIAGPNADFDPQGPADDGNPFGMTEAELTHAVDVSEYLAHKRDSMRCHRSQITDSSFFMEMPDEAFAIGFGTEWFIKKGAEPGVRSGWLFE